MTDRELMQQALDALDSDNPDIQLRAATHLRAALAQPEPEPVAWADKYDLDREGHDFWVSRQANVRTGVPLYTAPPQREWVGLTVEDVKSIVFVERSWADAVRKVEAKLKEKNT